MLTLVFDMAAKTCDPGIKAKPKLLTKGSSSWLCTRIFRPAEGVSWPKYSSCSTDIVNFKPKLSPALLTLKISLSLPKQEKWKKKPPKKSVNLYLLHRFVLIIWILIYNYVIDLFKCAVAVALIQMRSRSYIVIDIVIVIQIKDKI